jgi:hypothetical protein
MAFIKKDILQHLSAGRSIRSHAGYMAIMDTGYAVKCSNRSMNALLRDGIVVEKNNAVFLRATETIKETV